jgi:NADPH-dependent glutamate synthase beta subunit-like oxidoreductase/Pyruvate/2-oxoacid:ferredoxin oxidoreductase delta subunit
MGIARKKKKKVEIKSSSTSGGGPRVTSPLRPFIQPKAPPCGRACPQHTEIRWFLMTIAKTEDHGRTLDQSYEEAWRRIVKTNPLPAVIGRVCPHPCEEACNRNELDKPPSINQVERFLGDYGIKKNLKFEKLTDEQRTDKIAVLGGGPAGLSAAYHLARRGYPVTIFEAFSKAGGMLRYGIPAYRLPRDVLDAEIQKILDLGVELKVNTAVGRDIPYEEVRANHKAVFVGIGAHQGRKLRAEGEDAEGVYAGAEFLHAANSGEPPALGDDVIVIGGGDTAIDAARMSRRHGAKNVTIVYRRTIEEMPAIQEEIDGAEEEGIKIEFLVAPVKVIVADGKATGMTCIRCELGEPDASGRRRPVPIEGSEFDIKASAIIPAISQEPNFDKWGTTKDEGVFSGGDVTDLSLVTTAIAQGRFAAEAIAAYCEGKAPVPAPAVPEINKDRMKFAFYDKIERVEPEHLPVADRFGADVNVEINKGLTEEQVMHEAKRCLSCGYCFDCGTCWSYCQDNAIVKTEPKSFEPYKFKLELCQGCKKCMEECPCGFIEMQ